MNKNTKETLKGFETLEVLDLIRIMDKKRLIKFLELSECQKN